MPRRDDDYEDDDRPSRFRRSEAAFPPGVKAAGIIWIGFGALGVIQSVLSLVNAGKPAAAGANAPSPYFGIACGILFALVFVFVGFQTVKGTAKGTLGNGIGSLIFAALYLICGGLALIGSGLMPAGADSTLVLVASLIALVQGIALVTAGVLALMGKSAYEDWRVAAGMGKRKRRTVEEQDYDDRPRRRRRDEDEDDDRPRRRKRDDDDE